MEQYRQLVSHQSVTIPRRAWCLILAAVIALGLVTAAFGVEKAVTDENRQPRWSAWLPYWQMETGMAEAQRLGQRLDTLSLFAAYFDADGQLFIPEETRKGFEILRETDAENQPRLMLTLVNDSLTAEGASILKDRDLLYKLLETPESRQTHAQQILDIARSVQADGIELDYENLGSDRELWANYAALIELMQELITGEGLELSVVLEPSALDKTAFPEGPQYVVMLYNLYGNHSGPGPKADMDFISRRAALALKNLPGEVAAAFSAGGFSWQDGQTLPLTQKEAESLRQRMDVKARRDESSAAMTFSGELDGVHHEVWYADDQTLSAWAFAARETGIRHFYLWSLGVNEQATLDMMSGE